MEIKLLTPGYKKDEKFYITFKEGKLWESEYVSDQSVWIPNDIPDFPIYFASKKGENHTAEFLNAIEAIDQNILNLDRDYYMDELFWHSVLCLYKREYLIAQYPSILDHYKDFSNIVIKPFDWENYIYKAILIAQYVNDGRPDEKRKYYQIILDNMDMFNYIIKYEIFRNGTFLLNVMDIITDNHLETQLKAKIKNRPDLGADERYGRRVILELNRSYPIIMSPMLSEKELEKYFLRFLAYYTEEGTEAEEIEDSVVEEIADTKETNIIVEEKDICKSESEEERIISLYENWLKDNEFLDKVIEQYKEKMQEVSIWYKKYFGCDFYSIADINELKRFEIYLKNIDNSVKHRAAMKYYIQFIKEENILCENSTVEIQEEKKIDQTNLEHKSGTINDNDLIDLFRRWLIENKLADIVVNQYTEKIKEISVFYKKESGVELFSIRDVEEIQRIQESILKKFDSIKYIRAMKYYILFLKQVNIF